MTVNELIEALKKMPQDSEVNFFGADNHFYDTYKVSEYSDDTVVIFEDKRSEDHHIAYLNFFERLGE